MSKAPNGSPAQQTCSKIGQMVRARVDELLPQLAAAGHRVTCGPVGPQQRHEVRLEVSSAKEADSVVTTMETLGFQRWHALSGGAHRSYLHTAHQLTAAQTSDYTFVVHVRWREVKQRSRLDRLFRPTSSDWSFVALPTWAWRGYSLLRPLRLALERAGVFHEEDKEIAPFLATPQSLIEPLLDFANVTADDVLVDVGCGDGRIAVASAVSRQCDAIGIERSAELVAQARSRAEAAGITDRVRIDHGDVFEANLSTATVVLMFLPYPAIGDLLPIVLRQLRPGGRVVVHEQTRLPPSLTPDSSDVLLSSDALSVAHIWHKR